MAHAGGGGWALSMQMGITGDRIWVQSLSAQLRHPSVVLDSTEATDALLVQRSPVIAVRVSDLPELVRRAAEAGYTPPGWWPS